MSSEKNKRCLFQATLGNKEGKQKITAKFSFVSILDPSTNLTAPGQY